MPDPMTAQPAPDLARLEIARLREWLNAQARLARSYRERAEQAEAALQQAQEREAALVAVQQAAAAFVEAQEREFARVFGDAGPQMHREVLEGASASEAFTAWQRLKDALLHGGGA